jgi:hypothetical protein
MQKSACFVIFLGALLANHAFGQELLYNGIHLPERWPPAQGATNYEPMRIPYLESPPSVIPIDVGRQLFVDDFLIKKTTLKRTFHRPESYAQNPVLKPDTAIENSTPNHTAMPFSDGVWFDPKDSLFKMWYMAGHQVATCYAESKDGLNWTKPNLDVVPGTNLVLHESSHPKKRDSAVTWLDLDEKDPAKRFKMFVSRKWPAEHRGKKGSYWTGFIYVSADGIHWGEPAAVTGPLGGDRSTIFYNPFRKVWVYSKRCQIPNDPRWRRYYETPDLIAGAPGAIEGGKQSVLWIGADKYDLPREDMKKTQPQPQLYNLDAVAYESLMLGFFTIWPGQPDDRAKPNYVCVGFSRDGFHWDRPNHRPFINVSERYGDWNWANIQSAGGGCLVVGDKLYFYHSGRAGMKGTPQSGVCATGLAILRRDGFASMDAAETEGTLTTRHVQFTGKYLFVNVDAKQGALKVEVLDQSGNPIAPFSKENCQTIAADSALQQVAWEGAADLSSLSGKPIAFRFYLKQGRLYSFWVSEDASGASKGYVAAGGPGFKTSRDTVGKGALIFDGKD